MLKCVECRETASVMQISRHRADYRRNIVCRWSSLLIGKLAAAVLEKFYLSIISNDGRRCFCPTSLGIFPFQCSINCGTKCTPGRNWNQGFFQFAHSSTLWYLDLRLRWMIGLQVLSVMDHGLIFGANAFMLSFPTLVIKLLSEPWKCSAMSAIVMVTNSRGPLIGSQYFLLHVLYWVHPF